MWSKAKRTKHALQWLQATLMAFERVKVIPADASSDLAAYRRRGPRRRNRWSTISSSVPRVQHEKDRAAIVNSFETRLGSAMSGGGDREAVLREGLYSC